MTASSGSQSPGYCPISSGNSPLGPAPWKRFGLGSSGFLDPVEGQGKAAQQKCWRMAKGPCKGGQFPKISSLRAQVVCSCYQDFDPW